MGIFRRASSKVETTVDGHNGEGHGPKHLNAEEFEALVLQSELPAVVDFWAEWCGPCHMIAPSVDRLAGEYAGRAVVAKVNADEHPELLGRLGIMGIPTLVFFKGGEEVDRIVGAVRYEALRGKMERLLD